MAAALAERMAPLDTHLNYVKAAACIRSQELVPAEAMIGRDKQLTERCRRPLRTRYYKS